MSPLRVGLNFFIPWPTAEKRDAGVYIELDDIALT
jgi:hypothetical protein